MSDRLDFRKMHSVLIEKTKNTLAVEDYVVFTALLAVSTFIGLFFAWVDSRKKSKQPDTDSMEDDYLVGSRSVSLFLFP